jgi:hypothetical protein
LWCRDGRIHAGLSSAGEITPPAPVLDRDGTSLSLQPFFDVFNELHWRWHDFNGTYGFPAVVFPETTAQATVNTPKLNSPAGQRAYAIGAGNSGLIVTICAVATDGAETLAGAGSAQLLPGDAQLPRCDSDRVACRK